MNIPTGKDLRGANLERANLVRTNLRGAKYLSLNQLSKAKTLYETKFDEKLLISLRKKHPALFEEPAYDD